LAQSGIVHAEIRSMDVGGPVARPPGHVQFCLQQPAECTRVGAPRDPEALDEAEWIAVRKLNRRINFEIAAKSDQELYGKEEEWSFPKGAGDCEDYALIKRRILIGEYGLSPSNVLLTVVRKENGEGHAILTLRTTDGDFLLDNLHPAVRLWSEVKEYTFLKRQASDDAGQWVAIGTHGGVAPPLSAGSPSKTAH
jgi:predicted transglutaminase-like cysteine proteinase